MKEQEKAVKKIEDLKKNIGDLQTELNQEQEQYFKLYILGDFQKKLVGKCFVKENNYSCPEDPNDYWNVYRKVLSVDEDGYGKYIDIQKDKYGNIRCDTWGFDCQVNPFSDDIEITEEEFKKQSLKIIGGMEEKLIN